MLHKIYALELGNNITYSFGYQDEYFINHIKD